MTTPRIYTPNTLNLNQATQLTEQAAIHIGRVLRMAINDDVRLFNGDGHEYLARIAAISKKTIELTPYQMSEADQPLPLGIHLGQVISKGDRMDFTLQKATELGVSQITPLISERCDVRLKGDRLEKKMQHWHKVVEAACEQCGRNRLPALLPAVHLNEWLPTVDSQCRLMLHPHQTEPLADRQPPSSLSLLVGPEGGFSDAETALARQYEFDGLRLGPRILRTETAALTALSVVQYQWGDFR